MAPHISRVFAAARGAALVATLATLLGAVATVAGSEARAQDGERFVSLKAERANLRVGPGRRYPIEWVYTRPGLPLLVIANFDQWRWVRNHEGTKGWMHKSLLSAPTAPSSSWRACRPSARDRSRARRRCCGPRPASLPICWIARRGWCRIALAGKKGWVRETALWGVKPPPP